MDEQTFDDETTEFDPASDTSGEDDTSGTTDTATDDTSWQDSTGDGTADTTTDDAGWQDSTGDVADVATDQGDQSGQEGSGSFGTADVISTPQYEVPVLAQPSGMTCWATVATMMVSWRDSTSYDIPTVMDQAGSIYRDKFDQDQGLAGDEKGAFLSALQMCSEPPQDYAVEGFQRLLEQYGPIWVTTDEAPGEAFAIHARIVTSMAGDGSVEGTWLTINDPAGGQVYSESYDTFMQKYDEVAFGDMNSGHEFRVQVVHF